MLRPLRNRQGSMTMVMVTLMVFAVFIVFAVNILEASRNQLSRIAQVETQSRIIDQIKSFLRSQAVINYTLKTFNSPAQNAALKTCIASGAPVEDHSCDSINVDFYLPDTGGGTKFAGGSTSPQYLDRQGRLCSSSLENCFYQVVVNCTFTCPGTQTTCALVKTMSCDLQMASVGGYFFKTFTFSKKTKLDVSTMAIRLNGDLSALDAQKY